MVSGHNEVTSQPMDTTKLRTHVFEKTGIRIDTTDPVFALVALNDAVLADGVERQRIAVDTMIESIIRQSDTLLEAGERYKRTVQRSSARSDEPAAEQTSEQVKSSKSAASTLRRTFFWSASVLVTALLTAALTLCGLFFARQWMSPAPAPTAPARAPAPMTAEQTLNMQNGEKFSKILPQLDAVTQARILELMRQ